jgi:GT2 family glycosyltransferase/glycosyltransferase involved in cell wall biosynthesis
MVVGTFRGVSGNVETALNNHRVVISVLTWRDEDATRACLKSLRALRDWPVPTLVVDNGSGTHEGAVLAAEVGPPVEAVELEVDGGPATGYNAAIGWAANRGATHVLLLNNDVEIIDPDMLSRLLEAADEDVAAVAPIVLDADRSVFSAGGLLAWGSGRSDHRKAPLRTDRPYEAAWLDGPALLVSVAAAGAIGGLSTAFFMYWEDVDWGVRATRAGFRCVVQPSTSIVHLRGALGSPANLRYQWRNRVLFMRRNASHIQNATSLAWLLALSGPKALLRSRRSGEFGVLLRSIGGAIAWNTRDAIRRRRWRLDADGPQVAPKPEQAGTSVAILVDGLAASLVASPNPNGIGRVAVGIAMAAEQRDDIASWVAVSVRGIGSEAVVQLREVDTGSLPWRGASLSPRVRTRARLLKLARRVIRSLPIPEFLRAPAKIGYGRLALDATGTLATRTPVRDADLLIVAGGFWSGGSAGRVRRLADGGLRTRLLIHDLFPLIHPEWYPADMCRDFNDGLLDLLPVLDRVVTLSSSVAVSVQERFPQIADRVRCGVPTLAAHRPRFSKHGALEAPGLVAPFVLAIGTVEPRKNHRIILDAWTLAQRDPRVAGASLVVAGQRGWLADGIEAEIARDGARLHIVRREDIDDLEAEALYRDCLATVHASWAEGFGLPVRESVVRGIPTLLSSAIPRDGLPDVTYRLFDPTAPGELANLMVDAIAAGYVRETVDVGHGTGWEPVVAALID